MDKSASVLLGLLRCSLGYEYSGADVGGLSALEWNHMVDVAFYGGVVALSFDGLLILRRLHPQMELLLDSEELEGLKVEWLGSVCDVENDYWSNFKIASDFASALAERGAKCRVLKGMAFAWYYKHPEHRECGDCDVYLGDCWGTGNMVAVSLGGRYSKGTYKHSHLFLGDLMIENHRYLTNFNGTKQGKKTERLLEQVIDQGDGGYIEDSVLVRPNDHFNALFLIKHAHGNFMSDGMSLRMIYDWAAMLGYCAERFDWPRLYADLTQCRLLGFARLMNSLCVEYLGVAVCPGMELCEDKLLVAEVMNDTISGGIHTKGEENFRKKCIRILRRFLRIWHYREFAAESVPRMIWNNFAFSSYLKRRIEM